LRVEERERREREVREEADGTRGVHCHAEHHTHYELVASREREWRG
jgi:hypothetical protein